MSNFFFMGILLYKYSLSFFVLKTEIKLFTYRKVGGTSLSHLDTQAGFFRLSMKGKFDVCLLWPFGKK